MCHDQASRNDYITHVFHAKLQKVATSVKKHSRSRIFLLCQSHENNTKPEVSRPSKLCYVHRFSSGAFEVTLKLFACLTWLDRTLARCVDEDHIPQMIENLGRRCATSTPNMPHVYCGGKNGEMCMSSSFDRLGCSMCEVAKVLLHA